jgi:hypothetical protein
VSTTTFHVVVGHTSFLPGEQPHPPVAVCLVGEMWAYIGADARHEAVKHAETSHHPVAVTDGTSVECLQVARW